VSDYLPKFLPGDSVPVVASATVVGGQLVTVAGGVAAFDVVSGGFLTVIRVGVHRLVASATITIGQPLCAAANGQVRPWVAGTDAVSAYIGRAWSAAAPAALVDATLFGV
jgi:predicted RecA/RadA family phage recombinase